ncbi:9-O-acetylesterase [Haloferula helveola]|uniref:9-O-acetylesterase n=1 Tax=Haloferula helveola TaxID=490095 RepID=A0ABM7RII7_9BACT|nr:9-O-acetylesterase [Haloferula helveola]
MTRSASAGLASLTGQLFARIAGVFLIVNATAELRPAKIFTDHMVLQQELPVAVFGQADPGKAVSVSFKGAEAKGKADAGGRWEARLPAMEADGEAHSLLISDGDETVELKDVLLGEVWICGGQSNMGRPVTGKQAETADHPQIRLFNISGGTPREHDIDDRFGWAVCSPETIARAGDGIGEKRRGFTEVGYVFGRRLHEEMKVPVGLVQMNCGGSTAQDWTLQPELRATLTFDEPVERLTHQAGLLYEVRMRGIVPITTRGVVWYQGEDDGRNKDYGKDFATLIRTWRQLLGRDDLPFYFAQIAQTTYASGMLRVWEGQQWVMENVPHTGMAASNDIYVGTGNGGFKERLDKKSGLPIAGGGNPHPTGKDKIAERLARIALDRTYGREPGVIFGPLYESHEIQGDRIVVTFKHTGTGLATNDGEPPNWFELSDGTKDRNQTVYLKADAEITGSNQVTVRAEGIKEPKHVRFGWHPLTRFNLTNKEGIPATSFRSDKDDRWKVAGQ